MRLALWAIVIILVVAWFFGWLLDFWWPSINALLAIAVVVLLYTMYTSRRNIE